MENKINSIADFYDVFMPFEEVEVMPIIMAISRLDNVLKKEILEDSAIKRTLAKKIIKESDNNFWHIFREALKYLTSVEIIELFDMKNLKKFFNNSNKEYILFATALEKDFYSVIDYSLNHDEVFNKLFKLSNNFYSSFSMLDYDLIKRIIEKMKNIKYKGKMNFFSAIDTDIQERVIREETDIDYLKLLVMNSSNEVKSNFFMNDDRAVMIYKDFPIKDYILNGVNLSNNIVKEKDFMNSLKVNSLVDFRSIVDKLEENNDLDLVNKKVNHYYESLLNEYDPKTGLFKEYKELDINNTKREESFIVNESVIIELINSKDKSNCLETITSLKISEIITDALFKDNLYNVRINLREMLRYNEIIDDKVIDYKWKSFYEMILNLDNYSYKDKINIYNTFKDMNVNIKYYDDLRSLKDICYQNIKNSLFDSNVDISEELSQKYNVKVIDMRDKKYNMLIRGISKYRDNLDLKRSCYSLISNENNTAYSNNKDIIYYGYNTFSVDHVMHALERDAFSYDTNEDTPSSFVNRLMTKEELTSNEIWYSEMNIINDQNEDGTYKTVKPDYIVAYDNINNTLIDESLRLNIPIVLIKSKNFNKDNQYLSFDIDSDLYINRSTFERTYRRRRCR